MTRLVVVGNDGSWLLQVCVLIGLRETEGVSDSIYRLSLRVCRLVIAIWVAKLSRTTIELANGNELWRRHTLER